jgi:hypothetical protein
MVNDRPWNRLRSRAPLDRGQNLKGLSSRIVLSTSLRSQLAARRLPGTIRSHLPKKEGPAVTKKEELLELLKDEDVRRAIIGIVTSDSTAQEAPVKAGKRHRQAEATGGTGKRSA